MISCFSSKRKWLVAAALLLMSLINILPLFVDYVGGDMVVRFVMNECFSKQFWDGDIYPRWCFNGNTGLGAPFFLFYFPLPHYISAFIYPLGQHGVSAYNQFALSFFLATLLAAATSYCWLRMYARSAYALVGAALYLFMPYRMEVMLYRAAYGELWLMAFLPILFGALHQLLQGRKVAWKLGAAVGLCLLSHVPGTLIALGLSGVIMLAAARKARLWLRYVLGIAWGMALAAFYIVPAAYYKQYVRTDIMSDPDRVWANVFPTAKLIVKMNLWHPVIMMGLSIAACTALAYCVLRARRALPEHVRSEVLGWAAAAAVALVLLLPVSRPLYEVMGKLGEVIFPWRMQLGFMLAVPVFFTLGLEWLLTEKRLRTLKHDLAMLMGFMVFFAYFQLFTYAGNDAEKAIRKTVNALIYVAPEYQTRWTSEDYFTNFYMERRYDTIAGALKFRIAQGDKSSQIQLESWQWDGIVLNSQSDTPLVLLLDHLYFPIWEARLEEGQKLRLVPAADTGQMLLYVPAGMQRVIMKYRVAGDGDWVGEGSAWLSGLSLLASLVAGIVALVRRRCRPELA